MKKSVAYNLAQIAVMGCENFAPETKLDILHILMDDEKLAIYIEDQEKAVDPE